MNTRSLRAPEIWALFVLAILFFDQSCLVHSQRSSPKGRNKFFAKFFSPVRELVCSGKATEQHLDGIIACRGDFFRAIQFQHENKEYQERLKPCLTGDYKHEVPFEFSPRFQSLIYFICSSVFRKCLTSSSTGTRPIVPPVQRDVYRNALNNLVQCQTQLLGEIERNSTKTPN